MIQRKQALTRLPPVACSGSSMVKFVFRIESKTRTKQNKQPHTHTHTACKPNQMKGFNNALTSMGLWMVGPQPK